MNREKSLEIQKNIEDMVIKFFNDNLITIEKLLGISDVNQIIENPQYYGNLISFNVFLRNDLSANIKDIFANFKKILEALHECDLWLRKKGQKNANVNVNYIYKQLKKLNLINHDE